MKDFARVSVRAERVEAFLRIIMKSLNREFTYLSNQIVSDYLAERIAVKPGTKITNVIFESDKQTNSLIIMFQLDKNLDDNIFYYRIYSSENLEQQITGRTYIGEAWKLSYIEKCSYLENQKIAGTLNVPLRILNAFIKK